MLMLLQSNPLSPLYSTLSPMATAISSVVVCVGLFLWSQIEQYKNRKASEALVSTVTTSNAELRNLLSIQAEAQHKVSDSINNLAAALTAQAEMHQQQLDMIRTVMSEQKLAAQQMTTITGGFQRVVEQLIDVVKGS